MQAMKPQRFARAGLIDDERRHTAPCEPCRQAYEVLHLLRGIEPVHLHEQRALRAIGLLRLHEQTGEVPVAVRNGNALAVFTRQRDGPVERIERTAVQVDAPGRIVREHALGRDEIHRGTPVFLARGEQPTSRFVFTRQVAQAVGSLDPGFAKRARAFRIGLPRRLLQRRAHVLDFAHARAHFDGEIDGQIPDVVGRKVAKHTDCLR
jgi:hypothetical protein